MDAQLLAKGVNILLKLNGFSTKYFLLTLPSTAVSSGRPMAKSLVCVQNIANMAAVEMSRKEMRMRSITTKNRQNLEMKIPKRKATLIVEKSRVAREMKTREGMEYFPMKMLSPLASWGPITLKVPASQPRLIVRKIWAMVGTRSPKSMFSEESPTYRRLDY